MPTCYLALGALHALYKPIPGKFKDYIAIPKANGYQSLHTDLIGPYGVPVEVQIRTEQMHRLAESGVASHWMYKDDSDRLSELQKQTHRWLQSLLEIQHQSGDPQEFLEHVKVDLFPDEVYVFTPKGRILSLPRGATAVDFAYAVHTDIGNRCVAAKVNSELVPLRTELRNGDRVEIITASHAKPNPGWLQYVRTGKARSNIRHFLKTMQYEESASLGERLLDQALKSLKSSARRDRRRAAGSACCATAARARARSCSPTSAWASACPRWWRGSCCAARTARATKAHAAGSVTIRGTEGMAVQFAHLLPADPGRPDRRLDQERPGTGGPRVRLRGDRPLAQKRARPVDRRRVGPAHHAPVPGRDQRHVENQRGVLAKVASEIAAAGSNIDAISMDEDRALFTTMHLVLEVANRQHLARVMRALRRVPDVKKISRVRE